MNYSLSIAIRTLNEEKHIRDCINAIGRDFADYIYVIDSYSNDKTTSIAESMGAEVIKFKWNGRLPKKGGWFLANYKIKTKWILFLDADEILTESFKSEIKKILPKTNFKGFYVSYSVYFLGKKLKGGIKMKKLSLFQTNYGSYEQIEDDSRSKLDIEVHEHPIIQGNVGSIKSEIDHKDFSGIERYIEKHNQYSSWETDRFFKIKNEFSKSNEFNKRQKFKYLILENPFSGVIYFMLQYFFLGGWRDGLAGFYFALFKFSYFVQISCKIHEQKFLIEKK